MKTTTTLIISPKIQKSEPLSCHSTFQIGGPAKYFVEARNIDDVRLAFSFAKENQLNVFILGKGSNCLFDDRGFNGLVILNKLDSLEKISENILKAGSGYSFSRLGTQTARWGLSGLEFASGIPGSVGGAVFMNAGANGKETYEVLDNVEFFDGEELQQFDRNDLQFSYRSSPFHQMYGIIISATFKLESSPDARKSQIAIIEQRKKTQPLQDPSAGCAFRNPNGSHSGKLIEETGLKGYRIGGAMVSDKHANFIINCGGATAEDVKQLLKHIQNTIREKTGIELYPEVKIIPYE